MTREPGLDIALIDARQMMVLGREDRAVWVNQTRSEAELLSAYTQAVLRSNRRVDGVSANSEEQDGTKSIFQLPL